MRLGGKLSAAIEVLNDFDRRRVPLKTALADWARNARYAGAKDRAWISGLCLDALRRRNSLAARMGEDTTRAAVLGTLGHYWRMNPEEIAEAAAESPHGPGALTHEERAALTQRDWDRASNRAVHIAGDFPEWLTPHMQRVFGEDAAAEGAALADRADIDLRMNTLKAPPEKVLSAIAFIGAGPAPFLSTAARICAPPPSERSVEVTIIPAFNKGWVEVQDLGSQLAASAAGDIKGAQVLDYCSGGGGKTLALAASMDNKGQLYAYDADPRRLQPVYERSRRAGVRNLQIRNPASEGVLGDLEQKMDVVFVDAPCSGSGTWRRHPDTKWRLTPEQLQRRIAEQDDVLAQAALYVRPSGSLIYVTCSLFAEENEDRVAAFLRNHPAFHLTDTVDAIGRSGLLLPAASQALERWKTPEDSLRLTPARTSTDGFFIAVLRKV
jgi:16S rRNA (cytosine967-C5)-methyltransferase